MTSLKNVLTRYGLGDFVPERPAIESDELADRLTRIERDLGVTEPEAQPEPEPEGSDDDGK